MPGNEKKKLAEERYLSEDITLKALAEEMNVKYQTMRGWCRTGEWGKKRQSVQRKAIKKATVKAVNQRARELCKLLKASDEMESALLLAAKAIAKNLGDDPDGLMVTDGKDRAGNLTRIVQALGRQAQTRMMLSGIMTEGEQGGVMVRMENGADEAGE